MPTEMILEAPHQCASLARHRDPLVALFWAAVALSRASIAWNVGRKKPAARRGHRRAAQPGRRIPLHLTALLRTLTIRARVVQNGNAP